jgi:hypothetical protein
MLTRVTIPSSILHLTTTRLEMFPFHRDKSLYSMSPRVRFPCATLLAMLCEEVRADGRTDGRREVGARGDGSRACGLYRL